MKTRIFQNIMKYALLLAGVALTMSSCEENEYDIPGGPDELLLEDGFYLHGEGSEWPELTMHGAFSESSDGVWEITTNFEAGATFNITSVIGGEFTKHGAGNDMESEIVLDENDKEVVKMTGSVEVTDNPFAIEKEGTYKVSLDTEEMTITILEMGEEPYDVWTLIGAAVGGWGDGDDVELEYDSETELYSITTDLSPGEFKFRAPEMADDPWANNLGLVGEDPRLIEDEENVALEQDGANIESSGGNYTITLDVNNNTFTIVQNEASDITDWTGVALDAVGDGVSADNADAEPDPSGWEWGNVLLADNEGEPESSGAIYTWTWSGIILEAETGFKVRTLNGEPAPENDISFDLGYDALDLEASTSAIMDLEDGNLAVDTKGEYDITVTIDAEDNNAKTVVIKESTADELYMIGSAIGGWEWGTHDIQMIPVHSHENLFWRIVWLEGGEGFKFSPVQEFDGDFGMNEDLGGDEYSFGGDNVPAPAESGYYMVVVDTEEELISVADPQVYLIGDAIGSWDTGDEAGKFAVDNENEVLTFEGALESTDELRMYAWHEYFTDWWKSEFMIFDGAIEYRGAGDDQERVAVDAGNYVIDLDFVNDEGSIQMQ